MRAPTGRLTCRAVLTASRRKRIAQIAAALLLVAGVGVGAYFGIRELTADEDAGTGSAGRDRGKRGPVGAARRGARLPRVRDQEHDPRRRLRSDSRRRRRGAGDVPLQGGVERPAAVTLVPSSDWAAGIAASVLAGDPVRAPILLSDRDEVPEETATALEALRPEGSSETRDAEVFRIGDATAPDNLRATDVSGGDPAVIAAEVDRLRAQLVNRDPDNVLLASTEDPAFAMPAAAWAARSGDPVLFVERDRVPQATKEALKRHEDVPAYLLGPDSVASEKVVKEVEKLVPAVQRIEGENPAASPSRSRASTRARSAGTSPTPVTGWWSRTPGLSTPPPPHLCRRAGSGGRCWSQRTPTSSPPLCAVSCSTSSPAIAPTPRGRSTTTLG